MTTENLPLPGSGDDAPSQAIDSLDDPPKEEEMDVVVESTNEEELVTPLMDTNVPLTAIL